MMYPAQGITAISQTKIFTIGFGFKPVHMGRRRIPIYLFGKVGERENSHPWRGEHIRDPDDS